MRTKRPSKFSNSPYGRSSIDLGGIIGAAGGGEGAGAEVETDTAAIADVASKTPFTDKNFDAGEVQRFKPKNPVRNFLSGGKGTDRANQLNVEAQVNESARLAGRNDMGLEDQLNREYQKFAAELGLTTEEKKIDLTNRKAREQEDIDLEDSGQQFRTFAGNNPDFASAVNIPTPLNNKSAGRQLKFGLGNRMAGGFASAATQVEQDKPKIKDAQLTRSFQNTKPYQENFNSAILEGLQKQGIDNDANARFTSVPDTMTFLRGGKAIRAPRMSYDVIPQGNDPLTGMERPPITKPVLKGDWREADFNGRSVGKIDVENLNDPSTPPPTPTPSIAPVPRINTLQAPKPGFLSTLQDAIFPKSGVLESQEEKRKRLLDNSRGFFRGGN